MTSVSSAQESDGPVLIVEVSAGVATLTLNRPSAMNALNAELKDALAAWLRDARYDTSLRAVVIEGAGKAFCAGGDLSEMDPGRAPEVARARQDKLLRDVILPLTTLPRPVIAKVHGHAHGAGLSLALACDIVVAAEDAPMSLSFVHRGLVPDCGVLYFLPRLIGTARAKELLLTGRRFTGVQAQAMGMIAHAVPADALNDTVAGLAHDLGQGATVALGLTKTLVNESWESGLEQAASVEAMASAISRSTADHREALDAFREKRTAAFGGA